MIDDPNAVTIRWTRPDEQHLFGYSYSIVENILTCPVWGLIRYYKRKSWPSKRAMALEAGSAMHEVFAAVRVWQLYRKQNLHEHFIFHGKRLFNTIDAPDRFERCWTSIPSSPRDELLSFCYKIINTGEFYDDPDDRIRTIHNMEETTIRYVDEMMPRMAGNPIWVSDPLDATAPVGIEIVFDIMVGYHGKSYRYIGTIDGIVCPTLHPGESMVDENKTAARLDEAWRESFKVKSQPTGYKFVKELLTGMGGNNVRIIGVKIKQDRSQENFLAFIEPREDYQVLDWVRTLEFCDEIVKRYGETPTLAPQFTHSCNRYFRPCSFIDMCASDPEERLNMYTNSMITAPLTPSQEAILARSTPA